MFLLHQEVDIILSKDANDVSVRDNIIKRLNNELDLKMSVIHRLTQKIYQLHTKLKVKLESKAFTCSNQRECRKTSDSTEQLKELYFQESMLVPLKKVTQNQWTHHNSEYPDSLACTTSVVPKHHTIQLTPIPPQTSHHSSTCSPRAIMKRASTPLRRFSMPTNTRIILSHSQTENVHEDHTHHIHRRHTHRQSICDDGPGRRRTLQNKLQQLLSGKDCEGKDSVIHTRFVHRDGLAVLPPITTAQMPDTKQLEPQNPGHGSGNDRSVPSHTHRQVLSTLVDSSILLHRGVVRPECPGPSSNPPSSQCALHQSSRHQNQSDLVIKEACMPYCAPKETLLAKGSEGKVCCPGTPWVQGNHVVD